MVTLEEKDLKTLTLLATERLRLRDFDACLEFIRQAMYFYPESPEPHHLLGLMRRAQGNRVQAMKHFRAALDLDPTFTPARQDLLEGSGPEMADHSLRFRSK